MKISIEDLQGYLAQRYCGRSDAHGLFMKLVEEIGEVAEVLNRSTGRKAAGQGDLQAELGAELADMLHYIVAIAAVSDIDLAQVVLEKDKKAAAKYHHAVDLEAYLASGQADG